MLTEAARRRLCVVLVGARNPQNIGAAARAMQDFGFQELRIVNPFSPPFEAAQLEAKSAVGADDVMRSARLFAGVPEAIADCGLVIGTTAIGGRNLNQPVLSLQEAAPQILTALEVLATDAETGKDAIPVREAATSSVGIASEGAQATLGDQPESVAMLFGSEKTGLTREQLSFCSLLLTVPLWQPEGRHLSMNLGQAVAVCLYELSRAGFEGERPLPVAASRSASNADRERLQDLVTKAMADSEYARRFPANARPEVVRRLVANLATTPEVASTWMGVFRAMLQRMRTSGSTCEGQS